LPVGLQADEVADPNAPADAAKPHNVDDTSQSTSPTQRPGPEPATPDQLKAFKKLLVTHFYLDDKEETDGKTDADFFTEQIAGPNATEKTAGDALAELMGSIKKADKDELLNALGNAIDLPVISCQAPPFDVVCRKMTAAIRYDLSKDKTWAEEDKTKTQPEFRAAYTAARAAKQKVSEDYQKLMGELSKATDEKTRNEKIGALNKLRFDDNTLRKFSESEKMKTQLKAGNDVAVVEKAKAMDARGTVIEGVVYTRFKDGDEVKLASLGKLSDRATAADPLKDAKWVAKALKDKTVTELRAAETTPAGAKRYQANKKDDKTFELADYTPPAPPAGNTPPTGTTPAQVTELTPDEQKAISTTLSGKCNKCHADGVHPQLDGNTIKKGSEILTVTSCRDLATLNKQMEKVAAGLTAEECKALEVAFANGRVKGQGVER